MNVQDRINRIRMESQVKFKIVEEYIEMRQQTDPQTTRNMIISKYMPQAEFTLELIGNPGQVPTLRNQVTQNLNSYCNEAESIFFDLAKMQ